MKIFLYGNWKTNAGPSNVTRSLIENSDDDLSYIKSSNKIIKNLELLIKIYKSDIVISSGIMPMYTQKVVKMMNKKFVYLMHGYMSYENKINKLNLSSQQLNCEKSILERADKILCVSRKYSKWVKKKLPEYENKIYYLNNGVEIKPRRKKKKIPFSIAVTGGNRNIKNNVDVCKAAQKLNRLGVPCQVFVFGRLYNENEDLSKFSCVKIIGQLEKEMYYDKLDKIQLLIMNSEVESFGLVVEDALNCHCSILMSENVGALSIMNVNDVDIIDKMHDVDYLIDKIKYIFNESNSDRLLKNIVANEVSWIATYNKLKAICRELLD